MAHMILTCPHCLSERMTFQVSSAAPSPIHGFRWQVFLVCQECFMGVVAVVVDTKAKAGRIPTDVNGNVTDHSFLQIEVYPEAPTVGAPEHTPKKLAKFFTQGAEAVRSQHWDSAGAMFRKTLDTATKALKPEGSARPGSAPPVQKTTIAPSAHRPANQISGIAHELP